MANLNLAAHNTRHQNAVATAPAPTSVTSADVLLLPADGRLSVRCVAGATAGTLTVAGNGSRPALTYAFAINEVFTLALTDPAGWVQSDGLIHVTATQTFTALGYIH